MSDTSVCYAYENSEAVIVGTVKSIEQARGPIAGGSVVPGQTVTLAIEDVYKGEINDVLEIWQPYSSCDLAFADSDVGETYLLYLDRLNDPQTLSVRVCSRSGRAGTLESDRAWLRKLPQSRKSTFITGIISESTIVEGPGSPADRLVIQPIVGIDVALNSNAFRKTVKTDSNGVFQFWDVPVGNYEFKAEIPSIYEVSDISLGGFATRKRSQELWFDVDEAGCGSANFELVRINGSN